MDLINNNWFSRFLEANPKYEDLRQNPIAYFCAEFALSDIMPIYSGGLGVLAGDTIKQANELGIPFIGVGLMYKKGFFKQSINDNEYQEESEQEINPKSAGMSLVQNTEGYVYIDSIPILNRIVSFQTWHLKIGSVDMYLLDTDIDKNSPEDRLITQKLYGGDINTRISQEIVLGLGGEKVLHAQGIYPSIYHMNEGHSAFAALGIVNHCMIKDKMSFDDAFKKINKKLVYTNHTLVPAGSDIFTVDLVKSNLEKFSNLDTSIPLDDFISRGQMEDKNLFNMTTLALNLSYKTNTVSKLHNERSKVIWPNNTMIPITNGINLKTWMHPILYNRLEQIRIQKGIEIEDAIDYMTKESIWNTHQQIKEILFKEIFNITGSILDKNILTITWARRIAQYKRPHLLFLEVERLKGIINNVNRPVQIIISGKAHPSDLVGKNILHYILNNIKLINENNKLIYIPNYSMSLASLLVGGSDLWLNTPIRGYEACGTSGMKAGANGVLQMTTKDGWADEVSWDNLGWILDDSNIVKSLYNQIEEDITSEYYNKTNGIPMNWAEKMHKMIKLIIKDFSSKRMLIDYFNKLYIPSINDQT